VECKVSARSSMIARAREAAAHLLDLLPRLARLGKDLGALLVPPAVTRGDQIGHSSRLRETAKTALTIISHCASLFNALSASCDSRLLLGPGEELDGKLGHLLQSHPHDRSLGVASQLQAIDEPSGESDNVLQRTGEGDTRDVLHGGHLEPVGVEDGGPEGALVSRLGSHCGLAELLVGDVLRHVGSTESRTGRPDLFLDQGRKRADVGTVDFDSLDGRDRDGTRGDDALGLELFEDGRQARTESSTRYRGVSWCFICSILLAHSLAPTHN
jgi:hypothetical protein